MVVVTREEPSVGDLGRNGIDLFKVLTWIGAAALPWSVLIVAVRFLLAAFA
ncbi:MAG TPA: hypothetical protein VE397_12365 [Stellaceae bacterium]|nr:hypothetical protein [Stellaceae bacterium]